MRPVSWKALNLSSPSDPTSPTEPSNRPTQLQAWAQLVRLPNVFTVIADVGAAFLLVAGGPQPFGRWIGIVASGIALYWAGMILNDVFDLEEDQKHRSKRPIAAGWISVKHASAAGWTLLLVGVAIATVTGYLPDQDAPSTWLPAVIAIALAVMVVAYDGPLKSTYLAPAAMGGCRFLSFLLGASPVLVAEAGGPLIPKMILGVAFGFGVYIMGVTTMARHEATGGETNTLRVGIFVTTLGVICLAFAPQFADRAMGWQLSATRVFPLMIGLIAFPVIARAIRATITPTPKHIQNAIRVGVLTIIPLAACFATLGAGPKWGLVIFALIVPSILLATRFRVT